MSEILVGNAVEVLKEIPADSVDMCVTSPPYYGLRDYGEKGQYYQQRPADMGGMRAEFDFRTYIGTLRGLSERQNRGKTTVIV